MLFDRVAAEDIIVIIIIIVRAGGADFKVSERRIKLTVDIEFVVTVYRGACW